ncbi:MAG: DUF4003 domain-containing protein [Lachnospiraceae bacterium]|nr:DUF4003 domain-containing protein [Lachnospiraceae bacterium]
MRDSLALLCQNFIENRNTIKSAFGWDSEYIYPVCASIFIDKGQKVDVGKMKRCEKVLNSKTGVFSDFRGDGKLAMISMLALSENPEEKLNQAMQIHGMLKKQRISSQCLSITAITIANMTEPEKYEEIVSRTGSIYQRMKREHPFLTSGEDSVFAALLVLTNQSEEQILNKTEQCYKMLKSKFFSGNAVQSVSHVLALAEGKPEEECVKLKVLFDEMAKKGYRYGTDYELAVLAVLSLQSEDVPKMIEDIKAVDGFLAGKSGYGLFGLGRKQRLMHAGMIVSTEYSGQNDNSVMNSTAISGTVAMIAAQQAAMCAVIASTAAISATTTN